MIKQFSVNSALLLIDVQKGVNDLHHWGGPSGRRNNLDAESNMKELLTTWRRHNLSVIFTQHDSREEVSPLKISLPSGEFIDELHPDDGELVVWKDVNSAFIGTNLELELRRRHISRLVIVGFFTNFCVETTVRMSGNMGFDTYLVHDCCATTNRIGIDGTDYDPELVHNISVASMHREFCTALSYKEIIALVRGDVEELNRVQSNE
jgi:nicotinamidase-related amidase